MPLSQIQENFRIVACVLVLLFVSQLSLLVYTLWLRRKWFAMDADLRQLENQIDDLNDRFDQSYTVTELAEVLPSPVVESPKMEDDHQQIPHPATVPEFDLVSF